MADRSEAEAARLRASARRELALLFLRLGLTAFGGPAAHIAMMEDEVVRRRGWMTREEFLDFLGATNLIPGPNSTEMAIHIGHRRAGFPGLVIAGACFILPAALLTLLVAWAYVRFGRLPEAQSVLRGVKPVVVAIVAQALARLARSAVKSWLLAFLVLIGAVASLLGVHELVVLILAGSATAAWRVAASPPSARPTPSAGVLLSPLGAGAALGGATAFGLWPLFLFFLKVGSVLFGSGYVLLAFLRADLVDRWHWLTEAQLLDAVAAGQVTPGPVFTTATFIGYLLGRGPGAAVATLGIFLPAFGFVAASGRLLPRLRRSPIAAAFLDGVIAASLALMVVVTVALARTALVDVAAGLTAVVALGVLLRWPRLNPTWLVIAGAGVGVSIAFVR